MLKWTKVDSISQVEFSGPVAVVAEEQYGSLKELLLTDGIRLVCIRAGYNSLEIFTPQDPQAQTGNAEVQYKCSPTTEPIPAAMPTEVGDGSIAPAESELVGAATEL